MVEGDMWRGVILLLQYSFCFIALPLILMKSSEREAYWLLGVLIAGVIALDLHGIFTYYVIGYTPTSGVVSGNRRLETLTGGANPASCLNALMIVVVLWLRLNGKLTFKISALLVSIMLLTIVLTSSNSGIIAMSAGVLVFLACSLRIRQMAKILPILALPVVFFMAGGSNYLPSTFQERVLNPVVAGDVAEAGTFESRSALMQEALDMINTDRIFLIGIGADQFRLKSVQEAPVHNAFLILWAEGGILSLLGWLLFCSMGFIIWSAARAKGVMPCNRAAVLASFVVFIVVSNVSAHIYARYWYTGLLLIMQPTLIGLSPHFLRRERFAQTFALRFTRSRKVTHPWQVRAN
jgi:O-antigen ligase